MQYKDLLMFIGKIKKSDIPDILIALGGGLLGGFIILLWPGNNMGPGVGAAVGVTSALFQIRRRNKAKQGK